MRTQGGPPPYVYATPDARGRGLPTTHRVPAGDQVQIRVLEWGAGPRAIQILHGAQGNATMWQPMADAFPGWRVVASDHRGYGDTEGPMGTCTTATHVKDAHAVGSGRQLQKHVLVGFSGGGVDALHYAATYPDRLSALILLDPPMFAPPPAEVLEFFKSAPREYRDVDHYVEVQRAGPLFRGASPTCLRLYSTYVLRAGTDGRLRPIAKPHALAEWNESLLRLDVWSLVPDVRVPTLVVRAAGAPILPQATAERLVHELPEGSRLAVVENASHALPLDDPAATHAAMRDFLDELHL